VKIFNYKCCACLHFSIAVFNGESFLCELSWTKIRFERGKSTIYVGDSQNFCDSKIFLEFARFLWEMKNNWINIVFSDGFLIYWGAKWVVVEVKSFRQWLGSETAPWLAALRAASHFGFSGQWYMIFLVLIDARATTLQIKFLMENLFCASRPGQKFIFIGGNRPFMFGFHFWFTKTWFTSFLWVLYEISLF
jgi:hypothetical protein